MNAKGETRYWLRVTATFFLFCGARTLPGYLTRDLSNGSGNTQLGVYGLCNVSPVSYTRTLHWLHDSWTGFLCYFSLVTECCQWSPWYMNLQKTSFSQCWQPCLPESHKCQHFFWLTWHVFICCEIYNDNLEWYQVNWQCFSWFWIHFLLISSFGCGYVQ